MYQSNILPATYQPKVLGVLSIDFSDACASYLKILGNSGFDLDINSLNEGQIISVNNSIQLKVTLVKDACASISYNDPDVIKKFQGNMYAFVTPLETGYISINDEIEIL